MTDNDVTSDTRNPLPFDESRYVPVLLTRQGERHALREISANTRSAMTPLFVVNPINRDPKTNRELSTPEAHLDKLVKTLRKDWGTAPAFVDLRWIDCSKPSSANVHLVEHFITACHRQGLTLAPAISTRHSPDYRRAAVNALQQLGTSPCLRLSPAEWSDVGTPIGDGRVLGLLQETGLQPNQVHIVIDFEDDIPQTIAVATAAIRPVLRSFPHANEWASLTVAGTAMPIGTASIGADSFGNFARREWQLWNELVGGDHRQPSFGDYAVQHPDPLSDFNPLYMDSSAQLRYTVANEWFVARGRGVRKQGNTQIHQLAHHVVSHDEYSGAEFSWGDRWLYNCAHQTCLPGNQGVWRKATTNHHLSFVVDQLATRPGQATAF